MFLEVADELRGYVNIIISSRRNYYNKNRFINFAAMEIAPLSEIDKCVGNLFWRC